MPWDYNLLNYLSIPGLFVPTFSSMLNYILCVNRYSLSLLSQHNFLSQLSHVVVRKVLQLWINQVVATCEDKSNNVHESVHLLSPLHPFITHRCSVTKLQQLGGFSEEFFLHYCVITHHNET